MTTVPEMTDKEIAALKAKMDARALEQQKDADMLEKWQEHRKLANIRKVNELISELGLTLDDVASISFVQMAIKKALKGTAKAPATVAKGNSSEYVAPEPKWAKEGFKSYGGGRGKKPQWVKDAEKNGTLDNYLIKKPV